MYNNSPLTQLLAHTEALRTLAKQFEEEQGGLAHMLHLLADDAFQCAEKLEAHERKQVKHVMLSYSSSNMAEKA